MSMEQKKKFIVVVPDEEHIIHDNEEINSYIYQFIISKPCEELLERVNEIIATREISGVITRGSIAKYLYTHNISVPIFQLEYELANVFKILEDYRKKGFCKMAIVEMGYKTMTDNSTDLYSQMHFSDMTCIYYKFYDSNNLENTIRHLKEKDGVEVIIGDIEPTLIAERLNMPNHILTIDENCYKKTIMKAVYSTNYSIMEASKNAFIEDITNLVSEAIIIFDENGHIMKYNQNAGKLFFGEKEYQTIIELLNEDIDTICSLPANSIVKIFDKSYIVNLIPVIIDEVPQYALIANNVSDIENMELSIRRQNQERGLTAKISFDDILHYDTAMKNIVSEAKTYAKSSGTIMICGETGTGKEMFASSIHNESLRADGPFVAINCATFTESLIESELFGYEKGTFTGALTNGKKGLFELAHKGTIFLDEIAELPMSVQAKLLRVLQEKEIRRIGGEKIIPVDVRIIVATNKTLCRMVERGDFREDLYYRLSVLEFVIPPLRERPKDIIPLFCSFLRETAAAEKKSIYWSDDSIFNEILRYDWPGNVRELKNFAERVVLLAKEYKLNEKFIHNIMQQKYASGPKTITHNENQFVMNRTNNMHELESQYIKYLLRTFNDDKDIVCEYLNISKTTLWRKLGK